MSRTELPKILYVDDDSDDCYFLNLSLEEHRATANLVCAQDGEEAIEYLKGTDTTELPSLIILDLNMPRWDGKRTLRYLKNHPVWSSIPVLILSTSENKVEKEVCTGLGAHSFLKKPFHYEGYKEIVHTLMPFLRRPAYS